MCEKILLLFLIIFTALAQSFSQSTFRIQGKCPPPNGTVYGSVTVGAIGDIRHVPCPSRASIFTGEADFSGATIRQPFRLIDRTFLNFQGIYSYFSIGNDPASPLTIPDTGLYPANIELELRGDYNVAGVFSRMTTATLSGSSQAGAVTTGVYGIATNPFDTNLNRGLQGVRGTAYQRAAAGSSQGAYGGYFEAYTGGNIGGTNPTPMYGVYAYAAGGHNGTSPLVVAGRFNVSNIGGGGVGNITEGIAVHAQFDGGFPTTNYVTAKGLALQGWGAASGGGVYTNSYGIYADTSIDRGIVNRYFIYSLSTSDSLFSGAVRGVINPYNATTWNGSDKFATEDAIRDVIAGGGVGITGSGTPTGAAFFVGATQIGSAPFEYTSGSELFEIFHTTNADAFKLSFTGAIAAGSGSFKVGNSSTVENYFIVDGVNARTRLVTRDARIGDVDGFGNGTQIILSDSANSVSFTGNSSALTLNYGSVSSFQFNRFNTNTGTTGNQTINAPLGSINFAAGASTLVVTSSVAGSNSLIFLTPQTVDATCKSFAVTRASGSFTITANAACTAETRVAFMTTN